MTTNKPRPMSPDAEAVYDAEIFPLMDRVIALCREHRIPMLCTFQWADDTHEKGASFCTTRLHFRGESERLAIATRVMMSNAVFHIEQKSTAGGGS